jgi:Skp family chaperone for outer membrane proteins
MRKHFFNSDSSVIVVNTVNHKLEEQIGYIDMEYILQNVPNYAEASVQLEQKSKNGNKLNQNSVDKIKGP